MVKKHQKKITQKKKKEETKSNGEENTNRKNPSTSKKSKPIQTIKKKKKQKSIGNKKRQPYKKKTIIKRKNKLNYSKSSKESDLSKLSAKLLELKPSLIEKIIKPQNPPPKEVPTILDLIKKKNFLNKVQLAGNKNDAMITTTITKNKNKNSSINDTKKSSSRKNSLINDNQKESTNTKKNSNINNNLQIKTENDITKDYKPKVVIVDKKIVVQHTDVGMINKLFNEQKNANLIPSKTVEVQDKKITSLSFLKTNHTKKWTEEEVNMFYKAIEIFGLDFSFLEIVLKPRTRGEIKRKYLKEKKENHSKIDKAISCRKDLNKMNELLKIYKGECEKENLEKQMELRGINKINNNKNGNFKISNKSCNDSKEKNKPKDLKNKNEENNIYQKILLNK